MYEPPPPDLQGTFSQSGPQLPPRDITKISPQKRGSGQSTGPVIPPRRPPVKEEAPPPHENLRLPHPSSSKERTPSPGRSSVQKPNYVDIVPKQKPSSPTPRPPKAAAPVS